MRASSAYPLLLLVAFATVTTCKFTPPKQLKTGSMTCKFDAAKDDKGEKIGVSYDLTKLQEFSKAKTARVRDRMQVAEKDYEYYFGICTTVAPPKNCLNPDGSSRKNEYWSPGWQVNASEAPEDEGHCAYLGNEDMELYAKWDLLDKEQPDKGVKLSYTGGESCSNGDRRKLVLNFECSKDIEKFDQTVMDESAHCTYEITVKSQFACPTECGFGGGHDLCNKHGVCGYDTDAKVARCFCNEGYGGNGCDENKDPVGLAGYGPILELLIFVTIAIVGLVAAIAALFRYMSKRTMPMDGESYARLGDEGDTFTPMRMDVKGPDGL